ncbi:MAG: GIY-YIG nuclease family protein [Bacteroidota bacterium]
MYFVYILYSKTINKYYIGFTGDSIEVRLSKHLASHKGFTSKAKDWEIKRVEKFEFKLQAMTREKEIKKWKSRQKIEKLCATE